MQRRYSLLLKGETAGHLLESKGSRGKLRVEGSNLLASLMGAANARLLGVGTYSGLHNNTGSYMY